MHSSRLTLPLMMAALASLAPVPTASAESLIRWEKRVLETRFFSEGAAFGDLNNDGKNDIVYGPYYWLGPDFKTPVSFYKQDEFNINGYSNNFFSYVHDVDGDGFKDVLVLGFPGKDARWYRNPGKTPSAEWQAFQVADIVDNESPEFTDVTGDGKPEVVCSREGRFGYYSADGGDVTKTWQWHPLTEDVKVGKFTHGMGIGDVNGDGRLDFLEAKRWWEAPASGNAWKQHTFNLTGGGGAQMFAYDFNGDGRNDIITSLNAHQYGVAWFENKGGQDGAAWEKRLIVGSQPWENEYGVRFSQPHALALQDVDGDGLKDLITGKRYWAHNGHDPNERDPRVLYWFQTKRGKDGKVEFIPHMIDGDTGVGTQLTTGDIDGDGLLDVVVGNKYGCRVLLQRREQVSAERFAQFQPRKFYGPESMPSSKYAGGLSPQEAVKAMTLPAGFKAELVTAEPDLVQPIAMCWDERGRLWVVEGNTYPQRAPEGEGKDRILIFADEDGNGSFETRKVFLENLNLVSGIEVGFGGVWVGAAPNFLFIPDKDRDDKPDGPAQVLLDGWGYQDTHETLNSFIWGPDGWLYGCHGVFTHSRVGKPGTPDEQRTPLNCAVWRYHPVKHEFEVFAHGTSNPWGLDYNDQGEFFVTACVIQHLYHIVPGGRYHRQAGQHFNPHTYEDIKTMADHVHYAGSVGENAHWGPRAGQVNLPVSNDTDHAGGGHAHCGLAIYNGDNFPVEYRGELLFSNLHGHRLVQDHADPIASSYVGQHRADFMRSNDHSFISVTQKVGPDGALYISDWSDKQTCHHRDVKAWDRSNGRIYRIVYDTHKPWKGDLAKLGDAELAKMAVESTNGWFERMARRVLMERAASGKLEKDASGNPVAPMKLMEWYVMNSAPNKESVPNGRLKSQWALQVIGAAEQDVVGTPPADTDESVNVFAIRTLQGKGLSAESIGHLNTAAKATKSPVVRRELASLLQRLPIAQREGIAMALISRKEDAADPMIPLLVWYGIEPLVAEDPAKGIALANVSQMDKVTGFIYRRLSGDPAGREALLSAVVSMKDAAQQKKTLTMLVDAARTAGKLSTPQNWSTTSASLRSVDATAVDELSALFGDAAAIKAFREELANASASPQKREAALRVLLQVRDVASAKPCQEIIAGAASPLRRKAIQALAGLPDVGNAPALVVVYASLSNEEKSDAISVLASTKEGAVALLKAVEGKTVSRDALTPFLIRQLQTLKDKNVDALVAQVWGTVNQSKADLPQRVAKFKAMLSADKLKGADLVNGKLVYTSTCGTCHKLLGEGASVGPDLTGSNRGSLDYLLENVLDPNAIIGKAYQLNLFSMKDGRVLSGIVKEETDDAYRVVMPGGVEFTLTKAEVATREISKFSTMPEGQFEALPADMVINLVAYLQSNVSKPATPAAAGGNARWVEGAIEGESLRVLSTSGGSARPQAMGGFGPQWSGGQHLWWTGAKAGDTLTVSLPAEKAGKYALKLALTKARDYGMIEATLNETPVSAAKLDLYNTPNVIHTGELDWGTYDLPAGENKLTIKITGANAAAVQKFMVGIDYVKLEKR
ncbi:putative membrane-bound dehydrogenase-like protein [Roseimicrobium gellanilyticum]|uniref:Putative membrane-bound dehydrogenase-like protein n=1 Tax=Roseimicrobium gellanilyticum TaxID=748857 RepID=A0A366HTM5_9BACT|nr:PVC-type heme-binding CxxCH protein [Roseimicrobium gellanilyticum]RBP47437.1 putative membrane-bound dehydrogenase-like protein [Roseimicrobium gellanilyticum]